MNEEKIIEHLVYLKSISPDPHFAARSKAAIMASARIMTVPESRSLRESFWGNLKVGLAVMCATFLLAFGLTMFMPDNSSGIASGELNDEKLLIEATEVSFNIELDEAKYYQKSAEDVAVALQKIEHLSDR